MAAQPFLGDRCRVLPLGASHRIWWSSATTLQPSSGTQLLSFFDKLPQSNYFYATNHCYMGLNFLQPRCCLLNGNIGVMILTKFNLVTHHVILWNSTSLSYVVLWPTIFLLKGKFAFGSPSPGCHYCLQGVNISSKPSWPLEHSTWSSQVRVCSLLSG